MGTTRGRIINNSIVTIFHTTLLKYKRLFIKCVKLIESVTQAMINTVSQRRNFTHSEPGAKINS